MDSLGLNRTKDVSGMVFKWLSGVRKPSYLSLAIVVLLLIGAVLRLYYIENLHTVEPDEMLWLDAGTSLLREGVPTSWTIRWPYHNWEAYDRVDGGTVTPWLDHPPLYALMSGGWAMLTGQGEAIEIAWGLQRLPMALVSVLTIFFTYLFVKKVFGNPLALFVLLAFTFFPSEIIASRFALAENVVPLFLMLGLYALAVYLEAASVDVKRLSFGVVAVMCFAAPLLKLSGAVVPLTIILFLFLTKRYWLGLKMVGATLAAVGSFVIYAWYYSWGVFVGAQKAHMLREHSFEHFWTLFTKLDVGNYTLVDPSVIVGFIGLVALVLLEAGQERRMYVFSAVFVLSFLLLYISPVEAYVWYKYPLYPLLALGLGYVFYGLYLEKVAYLILFLPMVGMMLQHSLLFDSQSSRKVAIIFFYGLSVLPLLTGNKLIRLKHVFVVLLLVMFLFQLVWVEWAARCTLPCY